MRIPLLAAVCLGLLACRSSEPARAKRLFDGASLAGWTADIPAKDKNPATPDAFLVRDGKLVSLGEPRGHLVSAGRRMSRILPAAEPRRIAWTPPIEASRGRSRAR